MTLLKPAEKQGKKFLNPVPTAIGGLSMMFKVLPLYLSNREEADPKTPLGPFITDPAIYRTTPASGLRITWFGHASMLVELDGYRILIDPVWDLRASPVSFVGPKRFYPSTIRLEDLPPIDAVLISHDHYDHLGAQTVRTLAKLPSFAETRFITSLGVGRRLRSFGVAADRISELDWTQSEVLSSPATAGPLTITSFPARHFSGRGIHDRFMTLWASFVLEGPSHRIYFGADSGVWEGFAEIAARYDRFDLIMLEIGAFHPLWENIHLGPDHAAEAFIAMRQHTRADLLMPIHWGLFNLALHGWRQPVERLEAVAAEQGIALWSPTPGTSDGRQRPVTERLVAETVTYPSTWSLTIWLPIMQITPTPSACNPVEKRLQR